MNAEESNKWFDLKVMPRELRKQVIDKYVDFLVGQTRKVGLLILIAVGLCLMSYVKGFTSGLNVGAQTAESFRILRGAL
jgi:hypothetical protein